MIDDLTVASLIPESINVDFQGIVSGETPYLIGNVWNAKTKRRHPCVAVRGPGINVRWIPEVREVEVRLNIPRLHQKGAHRYNFPLVEFEQFGDLDLSEAAENFMLALGQQWRDPVKSTNFGTWPVKRLSYTIDAHTDDVHGTAAALMTRKRLNSEPNGWGTPVRGGSWMTKGAWKTQFYAKADEINGRIRPLKVKPHNEEYIRSSKEFRRERAKLAEGVLRFEHSIMSCTQMIDTFGLKSGTLPSFQFVARKDVRNAVVAEELRRLRLHMLPTPPSPNQLTELKATDLLSLFGERARAFNSGPLLAKRRGGAIKSGTRSHLMNVYKLLGRVPDTQIMYELEMCPATLRAAKRDLNLLGLNVVGFEDATAHHRLVAYVGELQKEIGSFDAELPMMSEGDYVDAPWVSSEVADDADDNVFVEAPDVLKSA